MDAYNSLLLSVNVSALHTELILLVLARLFVGLEKQLVGDVLHAFIQKLEVFSLLVFRIVLGFVVTHVFSSR